MISGLVMTGATVLASKAAVGTTDFKAMLDFDYGNVGTVYRVVRRLSTRRGRSGMTAAGELKAPATKPVLRRTIVLVGLMGAGKSSIGRRLATRLHTDFVDADNAIEEAAGSSIADIFAKHGEAAFREGERKVVARLLDGPPHVLATGGGAFMDPATRARVRASAFSIWLRADLDVLLRRVQRRSDRPLLKNGDPREIMSRLMAERYPVYAEADLTVDTTDAPHVVVVDDIVRRIVARADANAIVLGLRAEEVATI